MTHTRHQQPAHSPDAFDALDRELDAMPATRDFECYECTASETNIEPVAFDERVALETRFHAVVIAIISFGGIGWICLCVGVGLNNLYS